MKKTWILTAYDKEAQHIIDLLGLKFVKKLQHISFYANDNTVLAIAWIWKVQAAIWTTVLINEFWAKKIIYALYKIKWAVNRRRVKVIKMSYNSTN